MKICQINCVYSKGSTGKIVKILHTELLKFGDKSFVIHSIKNKNETDDKVNGISNKLLSSLSAAYRMFLGDPFCGAHIQTARLLSILKRERPDVAHLHCINGNNINVYRVMRYLALNNIPTVLTLHAEFPYTGGCAHAFDCEKWRVGCKNCLRYKKETRSLFFDRSARVWKKQKKCFDLYDTGNITVVAVSPWLRDRAQTSPMLNRFNVETVFNGIDTATFYRREDTEGLREKYKISSDEKVLIHVTAYFDSVNYEAKGGKYIVDLANCLKDEKVKIIVVTNRANFKEIPDNVIIVGNIASQDELAKLYSISDLAVLTSKRETFSMPVAEAFCCGTPVVGFKAGGPESIALTSYAEFVEYGNVGRLYEAVKKFLNEDFNRDDICKTAKSRYSEEQMYEGYKNIYIKLLKND